MLKKGNNAGISCNLVKNIFCNYLHLHVTFHIVEKGLTMDSLVIVKCTII
jgi:hypothetical protein